MNVPMPGGVFLATDENENNRPTSTTVREDVDDAVIDDDTPNAEAVDAVDPSHNTVRDASLSSVSSTTTDTSTILSELNCVHSFDDQGRAASYLQFFRKNANNYPTTIPSSQYRRPQQQQMQHQPFDAYSVNLTTRTPIRPAALTVVPSPARPIQQHAPPPLPPPPISTTVHAITTTVEERNEMITTSHPVNQVVPPSDHHETTFLSTKLSPAAAMETPTLRTPNAASIDQTGNTGGDYSDDDDEDSPFSAMTSPQLLYRYQRDNTPPPTSVQSNRSGKSQHGLLYNSQRSLNSHNSTSTFGGSTSGSSISYFKSNPREMYKSSSGRSTLGSTSTLGNLLAISSSEDSRESRELIPVSSRDRSHTLYSTGTNRRSTTSKNRQEDFQDSISCLSSASHLFGESLVSTSGVGGERIASGLTSPTQSDTNSQQSPEQQLGPPTLLNTVLRGIQKRVQNVWGFVQQSDLLPLAYNVSDKGRWKGNSLLQKSSSSLSTNLYDLEYLTSQHKMKCNELLGSTDDDMCFDFALILQPQNVYGFWSELLDFRAEFLGQDVVDAMDAQWSGGVYSSESHSTHRSDSTQTSETGDADEAQDVFSTASSITETPVSGVRRRRTNHPHEDTITPRNNDAALSSRRQMTLSSQANSRRSFTSPGIYSGYHSTNNESSLRLPTTGKKPQSVFDRALESPSVVNSPHMITDSSLPTDGAIEKKDISSTALTTTPLLPPYRRRWGNQVVGGVPGGGATGTVKLPMMSPPVHFLPSQTSELHKPRTASRLPDEDGATKDHNVIHESNDSDDEKENDHDPNILRMEDIPNRVIARGIAARTHRTNGMLPFLNALKRGIVLRRHRPTHEASFCKISSDDGGDTISYRNVDYEEAMNAFREQRVRHNRSATMPSITNNKPHWSLDMSDKDGDENAIPHNFSVPDYVAADAYRKRIASKEGGPFGRKVKDLATKVIGSNSAKIAEVVAVHPGRNADPRSHTGEQGTSSLRRSKSDYDPQLAFSMVILRRSSSKKKENMEEQNAKWHEGEGNDTQFQYVNFEAATEGEYWFVFRGLLLLQRDATIGRFAKQRAAGIGTNIDLSSDVINQLHVDEFHEPLTVGWLERTIVKFRKLDTTYMEGFVTKEGAVPPPSDYFLGFRSPGTAIWSRLRQAGLETRRVYSLDPNRVMIKIRCPSDRLMDVAEVLRVKIKTKDGTFAPFREDMIDAFEPMDDPLERLPPHNMEWQSDFQFRSSIRQTIIGFIIGSRIRDSGAELGQTTELGQMIQARVPLHVHSKLNAIYDSWFYFWKVENWSHGRTGHSLTHVTPNKTKVSSLRKLTVERGDSERTNKERQPVPHFFIRFFVGCMHQPLDSIETYFGEKVAFYFAWLEHTAGHLVVLSVAGLILFLLQVSSGIADHPLRPYFAMFVMIWTFVVLINWKKRANFLAYRWGTMNYKEQETTRPQFKGEYTQDEITGEWIVTCPKWKRWLKYCISFPLTLFFTGGTLLLILWVHANRDIQLAKYFLSIQDLKHFEIEEFAFSAIGKRQQINEVELSKEHLRNPQFWYIVVLLPSMLGLSLPLLNYAIMTVSTMLNDFENYRTESEYRTYLIIKVFWFRFICYFATLYYYSIISVGGDEKAIKNGILRVGTSVLVYTTVAQWWQNTLHVCFPMIVRSLRMKHRRKRLSNELRDIELEEAELIRMSTNRIDDSLRERQAQLINRRLLLEQAQDDVWLELMSPNHDSFPEYIQAVVQFAFVSCFSVVLPVTPLIVLFNHLVSMRLDAYKLCRGRRRPVAEKTGGIGVWEHVLHIVAVISVLTNCWLMGFTSSQFRWIKEAVNSDFGIFVLVVAWEHVMLLIKYIMSTSVSSLPKSVRDAMKRERYELDKQRNALMLERRNQQQQSEDIENVRKLSVRFGERSTRRRSRPSASTRNDEEDCSTVCSNATGTTSQRKTDV